MRFLKGYIKVVFLLSFSSLIAADVLSEEVWIDGDSFYKSISHKKKSTIYFDEWTLYVDQFLKDDDYYVAIQLDQTFDPLPKDDISLPTLASLAALGDEKLRKDYFHFLESFGRTIGVNHMVLPDTVGFSTLERQLIEEANQHSPYYFLYKSSLSDAIPSTKREYQQVAYKPTIWIIDQDLDTRKLRKWRKKSGASASLHFFEKLKKAKEEEFIPAYDIPKSLSKAIFSAGVVALDPNEVFPISSQELTYLGSDLGFRNRLAQYTKIYDYRVEGIKCVVDLRNFKGEVYEDDITIQTGLDLLGQASLLLPDVSVEDMDIELSKMLFGAKAIVGRSAHPDARRINNFKYLGYTDPELAGFDADYLSYIDSLAQEAIQKMATPGIQVAVVKDGDVIVEKSYGYYTYDSLKPVSNSTIYDIASVTKVIATLPAIGLLIDRNLIRLDDSLGMHLPEFVGSNKSAVTIRQLLAHNAGLKSYVPFWRMMMTGDRLDAFYYKTAEDELNDIRSYGIDPDPIMLDSLKGYIVKSNLIKNADSYHYSDLGFMILHLLVEKVSEQPFEQFVTDNFYAPMGLTNTQFNPTKKGTAPEDIAPTEYDNRYRNYQVWGEVHDRNALVFGGIAGHAGLFSTSKDLAKMMSMFLNDGYYGGKKYLSSETINLFNSRFFDENRRGLGWDKKALKSEGLANLSSDSSFGHTGFTGTMVWADPEHDLIYVFLSNRIYPDANNWKLGELKTRTLMHNTIYEALGNRSLRNLFLDN